MLIVYKGVVYVMTAVTEAFNGAKIQISLKDNVQNTARPSKKAGAIDQHGQAQSTAALSEARTMLPESSSRPLPAKMAHSRNLAHASLETAVQWYILNVVTSIKNNL